MEKKFIELNYNNTGIKIIKSIGLAILVCGGISSLIAFIGCFRKDNYSDIEFYPEGLISVFAIALSCLFFYAVCLLLAHLGRAAIIANLQRQKLLEAKGIELPIYEYATITIKHKRTDDVKTIYLSEWDKMQGEIRRDYKRFEE